MAKRNVHVIYVGDAGDNITVDEFCAGKCLLAYESGVHSD